MLKELLAPTLPSQKITIRQDQGTGTSDYSDFSGRIYPVVRIVDTVLNPDEIEMFELSVSMGTFLPKVIIQIKDVNYRFRESLKPRIDIMTLYLGTNRDKFFIKNDYLIESVSGSPGAESFTISGTFYAPELYRSNTRGYANSTGVDVITSLCKEAGLGLLVNFSGSDDMQNYIQDGITNEAFIQRVTNTLYNGDDTAFVAFIDHWSYLNIIDLKAMFSDRQVASTDTHPYTGVKLDAPVDVVLSNEYYSFDPFKIGFWSQNNSYTAKSKYIPDSLRLLTINDDRSKSTVKNEIWAANEQLMGSKSFQIRQSDSTHASYGKLAVLNRYNRDLYDQDQKLTLEMSNISMILYPSMHVPVRIFDSLKKKVYDDQTNDASGEQLKDQATANTPKDAQQVMNEEYSGSYGVTGLAWRYYQDERIIQTVDCIKLDAGVDASESTMNQETKEKYENYVKAENLSNYDTQTGTADDTTPITQNNVDMATFFESIVNKKLFLRLSETQKAYFKTMSELYQKAGFNDLRWLAYTYATTYHETAQTMRPIDEYGKGAGRPYGAPHPSTGLIYYGRGYVQLTWYDNYVKFGQLLGVDLVKHPEKANDPQIAAQIQMLGMTRGLYTGKSLKNYFTDAKTDWINARRIINGTDRAELIASISKKFYDSLKESNGVVS